MGTITVNLSEDRLSKLKKRAASLGVAPEDLILVSIEELLIQPDGAFVDLVNDPDDPPTNRWFSGTGRDDSPPDLPS